MKEEKEYSIQTTEAHRKSLGQFFTPYSVAHFMCAWACADAANVLDPATGNSIFLKYARQVNPDCSLTGYEIDAKILSFFGNPTGAALHHKDFLLSDWDLKYDAIVCNPPYNRFQAIENRNEILQEIYAHTGIRYSGYTNLYILFLIKSLYQLSENGRLAFLIPTEFLNSAYGTAIKEKLLKERLIRAIINIHNDDDLFFNATTTGCILLIDHSPKETVAFYDMEVSAITPDLLSGTHPSALSVSYEQLSAAEKWRSLLFQENAGTSYRNLVDVSSFCKISRGIATGANDFFCMNRSKMSRLKLATSFFTPCICRSADVHNPFFMPEDFQALAAKDKTVYLLDISPDMLTAETLREYISIGEEKGLPNKYLLSNRNPWYKMEKRATAPIWVTTACREGIKFVRNLAQVASLTTFHSVYILEAYQEFTDVIFCYFLTPTAQRILRENRKELGNGLEKFQPSDLTTAKMLNITCISPEDLDKINAIYHKMATAFLSASDTVCFSEYLEELDALFCRYL